MALELIQLGSSTRPFAAPSERRAVVDLFRMVDYMEDPFAGVVEPGEEISPRQAEIARRLKQVSFQMRRSLVRKESISGLIAEAASLSAALGSLDETVLGKKKKWYKRAIREVKDVAKKVGKVVKSPAFLAVVGAAANLIPGGGQAASAALLTASAASAQHEKKKKAEKEAKKAQREAAAAEAAQLEDLYSQYEEAFSKWGYTRQVWNGLSLEQKQKVIADASSGTLVPYSVEGAASVVESDPAASAQAADAAGLSIAMKEAYGDKLPGEGIDTSGLPESVKKMSQEAAADYLKQIEAVGKDNFLATVLKAVGQAGAIDSLLKGAGVSLPSAVSEILSKVTGAPREAGEQDLKNAAAASGDSEVVEKALEKGTASEFPIVPVLAVGAGAILVTALSVSILSRR